MTDSRHEDFEIVTHSITMQQVAEAYGFQVNRKGFMRCPFHANGSERTPSLKVYQGYRGFHCKACGTGGDIIRFVELLNNVTSKAAMEELSAAFRISISTDVSVSPETIERAKQARIEQAHAITLQQQKQADLKRLGTLIQAYERVIEESQPYSDTWCYCQNKLPNLRGEWEMLFNLIKKG